MTTIIKLVRFIVSGIVAMTTAALLPSVSVAETVRVPGTKASLQPPEGFSLADRFPGFQRVDVQASIMVSELPAPADELMKGMTKEALASKGMTLLASKPEKIAGRQAMVLHLAQQAAGTDFLKWMLVTGDQKTSLMIVGTFPRSAAEWVGEAIRRSVLSTTWSPESSSDLFEGLTFRVTPTSKLKLAGRVSNMLTLTESGNTGPQGPTEPLYIMGSSISETPIGDLRTFSEERARLTAHVKDLENFRGRPLKIDGLAAYEIQVNAKDAKTGTAMRLYQVIAPDGGGYFIAQGLVGAVRADELLAEFRRVTESFGRKPHDKGDRPTRR